MTHYVVSFQAIYNLMVAVEADDEAQAVEKIQNSNDFFVDDMQYDRPHPETEYQVEPDLSPFPPDPATWNGLDGAAWILDEPEEDLPSG